jgi:hypothetical protein
VICYMDQPVNTASWRYKMGLPRPACCESAGTAFQAGEASFWAFNSYITKHNIDRNKVSGVFHPLTSYTLPYWIYQSRQRAL